MTGTTPDGYEISASERDTHRPLIVGELLDWHVYQRCPFCLCPRRFFTPGPRGGAMRNVECPTCLCRLNIVDDHANPVWRFAGGAIGWLIREPRKPHPQWIGAR